MKTHALNKDNHAKKTNPSNTSSARPWLYSTARRLTVGIFVTAMFVLSSPSLAQSTERPNTEVDKSDAKWSVGAVLLGGCNLPSLAFLTRSCTPGLGVALQRQVTPQLGFLGHMSANYGTNGNSREFSHGYSSSRASSQISAALSIGPHWTFNPKSRVQVGTYLMLLGTYTESESKPIVTLKSASSSVSQGLSAGGFIPGAGQSQVYYEHIRTTSYSVGSVAGLTLDTALTENISVRITLDIFRAQYSSLKVQHEAAEDGSSQVDNQTQISAGLNMNPSLALRMAF